MGQYFSSYLSTTSADPHITHVIFDFDGVLIDSEVQYSKVLKKCVEPHGKEFTLGQKLKIMGCKKSDTIQKLLDLNDLNETLTFDEMLKTFNDNLETHLLDCPVLNGADRLIKHLHEHKVPVAICTGSDANEFEMKVLYYFFLVNILCCLDTKESPALVENDRFTSFDWQRSGNQKWKARS